MKNRFYNLLLLTVLAACSGGSTAAQPASGDARIPLPPASGTGTVRVTITIPSKTTASANRSPKYVSPSAQSIAIALYPVVANIISGTASATSNQDLVSAAPGCSTGSPIVCTVQMSSAAGVVAFGIKLYSGTSQTGSILSQLDPTAATERTIAAGSDNVVLPLALSGVPASIFLTIPSSSLQGGVPSAIPLTVVARDASNNIIIGSAPYETPITLTASDAAISFSPATFTDPTTTVTLHYNGNATAITDSVFATTGAATGGGSLTFMPAALNVSCSGGGCSGVANGSTPYAVTVTEGGYSGTIPISLVSGTGCILDSGIVGIIGGTGSVNLYPDPKGGVCVFHVSDGYGQTNNGSIGFNAAAYPSTVVNVNPSVKPVDPNGGVLSLNSPNTAVLWGSYTYVPLQSSTNPTSFQLAAYASTSPGAAALFQATVSGTRYVTSTAPSGTSTTVTFTGQQGPVNFDLSSFTP